MVIIHPLHYPRHHFETHHHHFYLPNPSLISQCALFAIHMVLFVPAGLIIFFQLHFQFYFTLFFQHKFF